MSKKPSQTRTFGTSKRESHDASYFYMSNLYNSIPKPQIVKNIDNSDQIPKSLLNSIVLADSCNMKDIPNNSIHFMVTSPPYNVRKDYDQDLELCDYLDLLHSVLKETWRVLVPGGRAAVNIANVGRKPYIPLHSFVIQIMLNIGFMMRGEVIWNKDTSAGVSCAWGSYGSASNPCLRDIHEYILIFSKLSLNRNKGEKDDSIKKDDFVQWSKSIWTFPAVSAKKIGHPAPYPVELPKRLIEFYTFEGDVILDPFMGSGSTAIAAIETNRKFIGYEINEQYIELAKQRIKNHPLISN